MKWKGKKLYSFLDGFSRYNQVKMTPKDRDKTTFITKGGVFATIIMMFGVKNAPATFQMMVQEIFYDYLAFSAIRDFLKHLFHLQLDTQLQPCQVCL